MKTCTKCKQSKPLTEFHRSRAEKDGYQYNCKTCRYKGQKKYYQTTQGKIAREQYRQSEKYKAIQKRYRQSKQGKVANKLHRQTNNYKIKRRLYQQTEKYKTISKRWRICHPEGIKARRAVSYAIETNKLVCPDTLQCHYYPAQAEQYHHWHGYAPEHWLDVVPICKNCHTNIHWKIAI